MGACAMCEIILLDQPAWADASLVAHYFAMQVSARFNY